MISEHIKSSKHYLWCMLDLKYQASLTNYLEGFVSNRRIERLKEVLDYNPETGNGVPVESYTFMIQDGQNKGVEVTGNTASVGASTFLDYLLPFELVSILLTVAVIGAVVIAKREKLNNPNT